MVEHYLKVAIQSIVSIKLLLGFTSKEGNDRISAAFSARVSLLHRDPDRRQCLLKRPLLGQLKTFQKDFVNIEKFCVIHVHIRYSFRKIKHYCLDF